MKVMKKLYLIILLSVCLYTTCYSQTAASYSFSSFSGTYSSIAGLLGSVDIALPGDNVTYDSLPIGFTFQFCGTNYTRLAVCTNGFISLANDTSTSSANAAMNIASAGWLMPYWDALYGLFISGSTTTPFLFYATTGVAPDRIFTMEWENFNIAGSSCASCTANFQVKLYETTGIIDFVYGSSAFTGMSATIGIANSATDWQTLPNTGSSPAPSSATFTTTLPGSPADAQVYRWDLGCTGTPIAGTISSSIDSDCSAYSSVLSLPGTTTGEVGLAYQWQSSAGSAVWADIPGATSVIDSVTVGGDIFFRCTVSCSFSGMSDTTAGKELFMNPPDTITGPPSVCHDSAITLIDDSAGGIWSSNNTVVAIIGSNTGIISCLSPGLDTFTYIFTGCIATKIIEFDTLPTNAGTIVQSGRGLSGVLCPLFDGGSYFSDSISGGVWSISNPVFGTITDTGFAYSLTIGGSPPEPDTIIYTITNSCGFAKTILPVEAYYTCEYKVNMLSNAGSIDLKVNPNPNIGTFTVNISSDWDEEAIVTITNLVGEQVEKLTIMTNKDIELKLNQPNGLYFLSASTMHGACVSKLILDQ
jgi:hypothetical protein